MASTCRCVDPQNRLSVADLDAVQSRRKSCQTMLAICMSCCKRCALLSPSLAAGKEEAAELLTQLDQRFEGAYEHLVREALDAQMCLHSRSFVQGEHLLMCLSGPAAEEAIPFPLAATNDVDMVTLVSMIRGEWQAFG